MLVRHYFVCSWDYYTIQTPAGTAVGNVESVQFTVDAEQWSLVSVWQQGYTQ